jgi:hypothetical protein
MISENKKLKKEDMGEKIKMKKNAEQAIEKALEKKKNRKAAEK